jgi:hypothetical protein
MNAIERISELDFTAMLSASVRSPEIPESADAYGWLVGSWELDCLHYRGVPVSIQGEAHFGWVLEGRAVQDVWIMPRASDRTDVSDKSNNMYGTTFRVWGASIGGIPSAITMRTRSDGGAEKMWCKSAFGLMERRLVGSLPKSRRIRFTGPAKRWMRTGRVGSWKVNIGQGAFHSNQISAFRD